MIDICVKLNFVDFTWRKCLYLRFECAFAYGKVWPSGGDPVCLMDVKIQLQIPLVLYEDKWCSTKNNFKLDLVHFLLPRYLQESWGWGHICNEL